MSAPALATQPVPTACTGAWIQRMASWIVSPDSTCPPGEWMSSRIGAEPSVERARSSAVTRSASSEFISPKRSTVRDSKSVSAMMRAFAFAFDWSAEKTYPGTSAVAMTGTLASLSDRLMVRVPLAPRRNAVHMRRMADRLDLIAQWIRAETTRPRARSEDIVKTLRELVRLYEER